MVRAWPAEGKRSKPDGRLKRFLARQVGPRPITERMRRAARRPTARIAQAGKVPGTVVDASGKSKLALVRSYDIPADDPSAARLANLSWTYDSAISAVALAAAGEHAQARQLLDQLKALQRTDGSLDLVYDTATGASCCSARARSRGSATPRCWSASVPGTASTTRSSTAPRAGCWSDSRPTVSLAGGPDVSWVSTQHNMVAYQFLAALATSPVGSLTSPELITAANRIAAGDRRQPHDHARSRPARLRPGCRRPAAPARRADARRHLPPVSRPLRRRAEGQGLHRRDVPRHRALDHQVRTATSTFNGTYAASGPFAGYRPYAEAAART